MVARSSWIGDALVPKPTSQLAEILGAAPGLDRWPSVSGYNLSYPRAEARVLAWCDGDPRAPAVAAWRHGTGRSAIVGLACDSADDAGLPSWPGYVPLLAGLSRWCAGSGEREPGLLLAERRGQRATVTLELDPAERSRWPSQSPTLNLSIDGDPSGLPSELPMLPVADGRWEAGFDLPPGRLVVPAVAVDGQPLIGPALQLPYGPEDEPRGDRPSGASVLAELARAGGGNVRQNFAGLFDNPPSPGLRRELAVWFVVAALLLGLLDIATRRLKLTWTWPQRWRWRRSRANAAPASAGTAAPKRPAAGTAATISPSKQASNNPAPAPPAAPPSAKPEAGGLHEALDRLKRRR